MPPCAGDRPPADPGQPRGLPGGDAVDAHRRLHDGCRRSASLPALARADRASAVPGRDRRASGAGRCRRRRGCRSTPAAARRGRRDRHRPGARPSSPPAGAGATAGTRLVGLDRAHARARRAALLGVLRAVPARRDRPVDGREAHDPLRLRGRLPRAFPASRCPERVLVVSGERAELVTLRRLVVVARPGALPDRAARRRDRRAGAARFFAFQWHLDGLAAYLVFDRHRPRRRASATTITLSASARPSKIVLTVQRPSGRRRGRALRGPGLAPVATPSACRARRRRSPASVTRQGAVGLNLIALQRPAARQAPRPPGPTPSSLTLPRLGAAEGRLRSPRPSGSSA